MLKIILVFIYAGEYYLGIEGSGCILSINKDMTFSLTYGSRLPYAALRGEVFHGTYIIENGFINFSLDDISMNEVACLMPRYGIVRWQGRKYLLPYDYEEQAQRSQKMRDGFCERTQSGEELKRETTGWILEFTDMSDLERIDLIQGKNDVPRLFGVYSFCPNEIKQ